MNTSETKKLLSAVVSKAWESETFKAQLIENPAAAIESLTGKSMTIPAGKKLVVRDQTKDSTIYLNIPKKIDMEDLELSDEQLEAVAGGGAIKDAVVDLVDAIQEWWNS
ncbi:NHLP leader peptide family RiPP precursor [Tenacibaculum sp. MEBiC06402]|uniref:NHLP leader peptide family RiPP precursor n=1 Tax=unclassified Tenacibaculum TaxID=2635139 RepID=UPI003B9CECF7